MGRRAPCATSACGVVGRGVPVSRRLTENSISHRIRHCLWRSSSDSVSTTLQQDTHLRTTSILFPLLLLHLLLLLLRVQCEKFTGFRNPLNTMGIFRPRRL